MDRKQTEEIRVNLAISVVPFGTVLITNQIVSLQVGDHPVSPRPVYSFPSGTVRIEPSVLACEHLQVL